MTDHEKLREAGLEIVGRLDDVITPGKLSRFLPGDLICRPLPPPEPTVEEAKETLHRAITRYGEQRQYGHERFTRSEREAGWMAWEAAIDALIAAVERREAREGE